MNYAQILPELLLGSYPRSADNIDRLRQEAVITAVLNLQTGDDMRSLNLSWETLHAHYKACHVDLRAGSGEGLRCDRALLKTPRMRPHAGSTAGGWPLGISSLHGGYGSLPHGGNCLSVPMSRLEAR